MSKFGNRDVSDDEGSEVASILEEGDVEQEQEVPVQNAKGSPTAQSSSASKAQAKSQPVLNVSMSAEGEGEEEEDEDDDYDYENGEAELDEQAALSAPAPAPAPAAHNSASSTAHIKPSSIAETGTAAATPSQPNRASGEYKSSIVAQRAASSRISARLASGTKELDDQFLTGLDTLTHKSRDLYERVLNKILMSVIYAALFLFILGLCARAGGMGAGYLNFQRAMEKSGAEFMMVEMHRGPLPLNLHQLSILKRAYGFSCFCNFVGCLMALWAAVRISPFLCGATGEYKIVTGFQRWERKMPDGKYEKVGVRAPPSQPEGEGVGEGDGQVPPV